MLEAYRLGLGEPIALSAEHGEGIADLFEALRPHDRARATADAAEEDEDDARRRSSWRSSAAPTPASRRWSTACSARSG